MIDINESIKIEFLNDVWIYKLDNGYNLVFKRSSTILTILNSYDNIYIDKYYLTKFITYLRKATYLDEYGTCDIKINNRIFRFYNFFMYITIENLSTFIQLPKSNICYIPIKYI